MDLLRKSGWLSSTEVLDGERNSLVGATGDDDAAAEDDDGLRAAVYRSVMLRLAGLGGEAAPRDDSWLGGEDIGDLEETGDRVGEGRWRLSCVLPAC